MRSAATGAQVGEADAVGDGDDETLAEGLFEGETVKGETEMLGETLGATELLGVRVCDCEAQRRPDAGGSNTAVPAQLHAEAAASTVVTTVPSEHCQGPMENMPEYVG